MEAVRDTDAEAVEVGQRLEERVPLLQGLAVAERLLVALTLDEVDRLPVAQPVELVEEEPEALAHALLGLAEAEARRLLLLLPVLVAARRREGDLTLRGPNPERDTLALELPVAALLLLRVTDTLLLVLGQEVALGDRLGVPLLLPEVAEALPLELPWPPSPPAELV